jgi:predicted ABC-type ATPase
MPKVVVFGGVNGAGKTTSALELLATVVNIPIFTNADAIARGLNWLNSESVAFEAGRVQLNWLEKLADNRKDFSFETTLSARTYAPWLKSLKDKGYDVALIYFWVDSADTAVNRVRMRVRSGGHDIPETDIRRRYCRSVRNFIELYSPICDYWEVYDNTASLKKLLAIGNKTEVEYDNICDWERFHSSAYKEV